MSLAPWKGEGASKYKPEAYRIGGEKLVCLINASVTVIPGADGKDKEIYVFGGFDSDTDEVYNHVLRLDLKTRNWELVDNYGDIPCVRMGHTTTYWKDDKLISFGGENDVRAHLNDVFIFDIPTATWSRPQTSGIPPAGRSRHAVCLYDEKLFILGGLAGECNVLDDVCYLDLRTWTWSKSWKFSARFDHQCWVWGGKLWVFGGLTPKMDRTGELQWFDLQDLPSMKSATSSSTMWPSAQYRSSSNPQATIVRSRPKSRSAVSSGSISFRGGTCVPETFGTHFHHITSSTLLDFVTPSQTIRTENTSISALDLDTLTWRTLTTGPEAFGGGNYRFYYLAVSPTSSDAYLIGSEPDEQEAESLSVILPIDLKHYGVVPDSDTKAPPTEGTMGGDIGKLFAGAQQPSSPMRGDFEIYGLIDEVCEGDEHDGPWGKAFSHPATPQPGLAFQNSSRNSPAPGAANDDHHLPAESVRSPPIYAHKLILLARWPHFQKLLDAKMTEYHTGKLFLPEPHSILKSFINYLYTDSIAPSEYTPDLSTVAGLLPLANLYALPRLRALIVERITKELDIDSCAVVWARARIAHEDDLRRRAAAFCLANWGRVVRTSGFRKLGREGLWELCSEVDLEGRVVAGGMDSMMDEEEDDNGDGSEDEDGGDDGEGGYEVDADGDVDGMDGVVGN